MGSPQPVNITWQESISGNTLTITSAVKVPGMIFPFFTNDINCDLRISKQLRTSVTINDNVGGVDLSTVKGVNLTSIDLKASTGIVRAALIDNVTLTGPLKMEASTGGVDLT